MEGVVPVRHARTYGFADEVIGLRKAVDGGSPAESRQPLLDDSPSTYGIVVVVGIAMAWTEEEDQFEIVRVRNLDDLKDRVECGLIEVGSVWLADLGAPDIACKALKWPFRVASRRTV